MVADRGSNLERPGHLLLPREAGPLGHQADVLDVDLTLGLELPDGLDPRAVLQPPLLHAHGQRELVLPSLLVTTPRAIDGGVAASPAFGWARSPADRTTSDVAIGTITDSCNAAFNPRTESSSIADLPAEPVREHFDALATWYLGICLGSRVLPDVSPATEAQRPTRRSGPSTDHLGPRRRLGVHDRHVGRRDETRTPPDVVRCNRDDPSAEDGRFLGQPRLRVSTWRILYGNLT